jgi:hypothetical protein
MNIWDEQLEGGFTLRQKAKQLRESGMEWGEVGKALGKTANACRKAVMAPPVNGDNQPVDHYSTERYKYLLLKQANKRLEQNDARQRASQEILAEVIRESLAAMQPIKVPPPVIVSNNYPEEIACVHVSDCQVSQLVSYEHTQGINEYNSNIFCHRARALAEKIVTITDLHRNHSTIKKLVVFLGGDIVENDTMRGASKNLTDLEIGLQMTLSYRVLTEMLLVLSQHFEMVEVECVQGNHGRIGKPGENHPMSNYDHIVYTMMKDVLQVIAPERITMNVPYSTFVLRELMGYKFLMVHGEEIKSWMGIPFYGASREKDELEKLMEWIGESIDYLLIGHHHRFANWEHSIGEILMNGS